MGQKFVRAREIKRRLVQVTARQRDSIKCGFYASIALKDD